MDAQGPERARPYTEAAGATFVTAVDEDNLLGRTYGFKAIPNGLLIDESGVLRYTRFGGVDVRRPDTTEVLRRWTGGSNLDDTGEESVAPAGVAESEAQELFSRGLVRYREGRTGEAVADWRRALALDPDNYIIHKQIWAVENPERFYDGDVDYDWQKHQMEQGR